MDDEVRQRLLDTGELDQRLTLNEYRSMLERKDADLAKKQATIETLTAQVRTAELTGRQALDALTPLPVAQLRREAASYAQDALACVQGFSNMPERLAALQQAAETEPWATPAALSMVSLLAALQDAVGHQLSALIERFGLDVEAPPKALMHMALPGPEELALIQRAMSGVLVGFDARHQQMEYAQYLEQRKAKPQKGAMRKAPGAGAGAAKAGKA